jgi:NADH-quinone oxidoreductase subunit M
MVLFTFSSIGVPGFNGFAGEFLILLGMFQRAWAESPAARTTEYLAISLLALSGVVIGAWYMLWLVQRVFFGPLKEPPSHGHDEPVEDLSLREILALAPLAVFVLWIGLRPGDFLSRMQPTLEAARRPAAAVVLAESQNQGLPEAPITKSQAPNKIQISNAPNDRNGLRPDL